MNFLKQNSRNGSSANKGLTEEQIRSFAEKHNEGKKLPIAFQEFLLVAGEYDSSSTNNEDWDELNEAARDTLELTNNKIDRPFLAFWGIDDGSQFHFIYLDEIDEDPQVYTAVPAMTKHGIELIAAMNYKFSELVNENVLTRKKRL